MSPPLASYFSARSRKFTSSASGVSVGCICTRQICSRSSTPGISNSTCVRMRRSNAGSKFAARFVAKITTPLNRSSSCSSTLTTVFDSRWKPWSIEVERRDAMASASSKKSTACSCRASLEHRGDILRRFAHPHRFELGITHDQQPAPERVRDGLGADRLAGAGRSGEIEGEREAGRVPFGQAPPIEDQVVAGHLRQRLIQRAPRRGRENDVSKRMARDNRLDGAVRPGQAFKETVEGKR